MVKMKQFAVLIFSFFIALNTFSQKIDGQWRGFFNSRGDIVLSGSNTTEYVLELDINGTEVSGYSYSYFQGRKYYVICSLKGTYFKGSKSIRVTETARIKGNTPPDFTDCLQVHYLSYEKDGSLEKLDGRWEQAPNQPGGGCGSGLTTLTRRTLSKDLSSFNKAAKPRLVITKKPVTKAPPIANNTKKPTAKPALPKPQYPIVKNTAKPKTTKPTQPIEKTQPLLKEIPKAKVDMEEVKKPAPKPALPQLNFEKRKADVLKSIQIENETFKVDLYDNGDIDGDSVSLFYNGKLILPRKRLSDKPISLTLDASTGNDINELTMYAENLGEIPPNTALMVVTDGDKRYEVRISSDLKNSGTIHFLHKPKTQ
jgi:hypothetical protein